MAKSAEVPGRFGKGAKEDSNLEHRTMASGTQNKDGEMHGYSRKSVW